MLSPSLGTQLNSANTLSTNLPTNLLATNPLNAGTTITGASQAVTHTFTVTNTLDSGVGSLRAAITAANADTSGAADVINFNLTGTGPKTILLNPNLGFLDITAKNLTIINGTGTNNLSISGNKQVRDFQIEAGANVTISNLTITQGSSSVGGGIFNNGTLTLNNDIISNNSVGSIRLGGGGIFNAGTLTLNGDTISNNSASNRNGGGGGIYNQGTLTLNDNLLINNSAGDTGSGGAIYNDRGTVTIGIGSAFSNNSAGNNGGAILNNSGILTVSNTAFSKNSAGNNGGAIFNVNNGLGVGGTVTLNGSDFADNSAGNDGGGIDNFNGTVNASVLIFSNNISTQSAGTPTNNNNVFGNINFTSLTVDSLSDAVDNNAFSTGHTTLRDALAVIAPGGTINFAPGLAGGTITLNSELDITKNVTIQGLGANQLTISGNHQFRDFNIGTGANVTLSGLTITNGNSLGNGGGILNEGTLTLNQDEIQNNQANIGGGIFNDQGATLTVNASTISHNTVKVLTFGNNPNPLSGGGLANLGTAILTNTTIAGNNGSVGKGGGILNTTTGNLTLNNDTITGNSASFGGGVFNQGTATVHNTIIAQNTAIVGADIDGTFTSKGFNLIGIEDLNAATGFTNGQKGDIVGTATKPIDPKLGTLQNNGGFTFTEALLAGSPAINTGDPNNGNNPTTDQRGITRPQRGRADIGAYELV
jgi:hypothetical protein